MKIVKTLKPLTEGIKKLTEAEAQQGDTVNVDDLAKDLNTAPQDVVDLDDASKKEIAGDILQGVADENSGKVVSADEAERLKDAADEQAKIVKLYQNILLTPYGTGRPGKIKDCLQRSLETALRQRRLRINENYPNVLVFGLAGFGKTSIIQEFCQEHNLGYFECDAKNLDAATVGGIPYPVKNKKGETVQKPIASAYWNGLEKPCILFLDEINRANSRVRGSLLTLINNHRLPSSGSEEDGESRPTHKYQHILFTVMAINPSDSTEELDTEPLDPPMVSRMGAIIKQEGDKKEFKNWFTGLVNKTKNKNIDKFNDTEDAEWQADPNLVVNPVDPKQAAKDLKKLYGEIKKNPNLKSADMNTLIGQGDLMIALMDSPLFKWNTQQECSDIYELQREGEVYNYLNYRSLALAAFRCDGTKNDFLNVIKNESRFTKEKVQMIENIFISINYQDKIATGNNVFGQVKTQRSMKAEADAADALNIFMSNLGDGCSSAV